MKTKIILMSLALMMLIGISLIVANGIINKTIKINPDLFNWQKSKAQKDLTYTYLEKTINGASDVCVYANYPNQNKFIIGCKVVKEGKESEAEETIINNYLRTQKLKDVITQPNIKLNNGIITITDK
jgi:hypothetical protein